MDAGVKTAATDTEEIAVTIAASANCRPLTKAKFLFTAQTAREHATERLRAFKRLLEFKFFIFLSPFF
jgi:hypothetical protein